MFARSRSLPVGTPANVASPACYHARARVCVGGGRGLADWLVEYL